MDCKQLFSTRAFMQYYENITDHFWSTANICNTFGSMGLLSIGVWLSLKGLNATIKILQYLLLLALTIFVFLWAITIFIPPKFVISSDIFSLREDPLFNLKFWGSIMPISMQVLTVGEIIWLGRFKPNKIRPDLFTIIIHVFRYTYFVFVYCWMIWAFKDINTHYGISPICHYQNPFSMLLVGIPDMLLRHYPSGFPCGVWYFIIFIMFALTAFCRLLCIMDGFLELKLLQSRKKYLVLVVLLIAVLYNLQYGYILSKNFFTKWFRYFTRPMLCFQFFVQCTAIIHIYSIKKLMHDYEFTYKISVGETWIKMWKGFSIYILMLFVIAADWLFTFIDEIHASDSATNIWIIIYLTFTWIVISMPTIILFVLHACKHLKKHAIYKTTLPLESWGPHNPEDRVARAKFLPDRDIKYRHKTATCKHLCLLSLKAYQMEKRLQKARFKKMLSEYQGDLDKYGKFSDSSTDDEDIMCSPDESFDDKKEDNEN